MSTKISSFEIENVKRIKIVEYEPSQNGLTVIGGKNNQGKTSVLDSIAWVLGGEKFRPSAAVRDGSVAPPYMKITLSNGIIVERKGKNSDLKVIDPTGKLAGQQLLNHFIGQFALDIPRFIESNNKEKAQTLLNVIGVGDTLFKLESEEKRLYDKRHTIGQIADQKRKFANEMPEFPEAPSEPVSVSELINRQQAILARNGENQLKRRRHQEYERELHLAEEAFKEAERRLERAKENYETATKSIAELIDESTAEIEESIRNIEEINNKVKANLDRKKAEIDAEEYQKQYDDLTSDIESVRTEKLDLLKNANLPLDELTVESGELIYKGKKWDSMSASQQLMVATAIIRKLNPECGFVLLDKLEQMDLDTLNEFNEWLTSENLQAIATRVSTGDECSIIITDGMIEAKEPQVKSTRSWEEGF